MNILPCRFPPAIAALAVEGLCTRCVLGTGPARTGIDGGLVVDVEEAVGVLALSVVKLLRLFGEVDKGGGEREDEGRCMPTPADEGRCIPAGGPLLLRNMGAGTIIPPTE